MCTALSYKTDHNYFGRNLDLERGYGESVLITPRNFELKFRYVQTLKKHYAMIGMAATVDGYPLYFEATNEKGLSMAGLNFPQNTIYGEYEGGKENVAPFEFIPYILGNFGDVNEVRGALARINVIHCSFSDALPVSPLHWIISDSCGSITVECTKDGMKVYDNPFGVLTNNPTFDFHITNINNYMGLGEGLANNMLSSKYSFVNYSLGLGAIGLPGDFSSSSRFVKTVFIKEKSVCDGSEDASVNQFFHILQAVAMPYGCVMTPSGEYEYTRYSCCCNTDTQVYYYTSYSNMSLRKVDMHSVDLNGCELYMCPFEE